MLRCDFSQPNLKTRKLISASACLLRGKSQCAQVIICLSQINLENKKNSFFHLRALFNTMGGRGFSCAVSDVGHNCKTENVKSIALSYSLALINFLGRDNRMGRLVIRDPFLKVPGNFRAR